MDQGVNLDSSLNLESHFDKMYKRAAGRFNLLRRIRPLFDKSSAEKIYKAMIQPVFTYCGTLGLWVSVGHVPIGVEVRKSFVEIIKSRQWRV